MSAFPLIDFIAGIDASPLVRWRTSAPWELTTRSESIVRRLLDDLPPAAYRIADGIAIHASAVVEAGAVIKGPLIVGPHCFVAAGAYLRGGNWIGEHCVVGPGAELKSSFVFDRTKLAHFNFVGDSILGSDVNLEAGSIVCNHRNERADKEIQVRIGGSLHRTGCDKFGALVGDRSRLGANAVVAPGALLPAGTIIARTALHDDESQQR